MKQITTIILLLVFTNLFSQEIKTSDFTENIGKYDVSNLWTLDKFQIENDTIIVNRPAPLGFIGENYQRFQIHFISAIKNPTDSFEYFIYGKTKVNDNICDFQGTIKLKESRLLVEGEIPTLKQGFISGTYEFYENPKQKGTGILKGEFKSYFYFDENEILKYDALAFVADGFDNNQFKGTWTSYKTGKTKKCNWGDYRIPECNWANGCDIGAGEFSINPKYAENGWENYRLANKYDDSPEVLKAKEIENKKWWINDK